MQHQARRDGELCDRSRARRSRAPDAEVDRDGNFARLEEDGTSIGWFHVKDLEPAPSEHLDPLTNAVADLLHAAMQKQREHPGMNLRKALDLVARETPAAAERYQQAAAPPAPGTAQTHASDRLAALAQARADAKGIAYGDAVREIVNEQPTLVAAWRHQADRYTSQ